MVYPKNRNIHRPLHLYNKGEIYFISSRTAGKVDYFIGDRKRILKNCLLRAIELYKPVIYAWVILNNYYHLLLSFKNEGWDQLMSERSDFGCDKFHSAKRNEICYQVHNNKFHPSNRRTQFVRPNINLAIKRHSEFSKFIQYIHRESSRLINKLDYRSGRKIWFQYWDSSIRNEKDFYTHFNYIHENPIKHGLVRNLDELVDYRFCSYKEWLSKLGDETITDIIRMYPVVDYSNWDN